MFEQKNDFARSIYFNKCFGAQEYRLIEHPQHMFWLRNKKIIVYYPASQE